MSKTLQKCVKYSVKELEAYAQSEESCVEKIHTKMHMNLQPFALSNIKKAIYDRLQKKVGVYDLKLDGIILAVKNIIVLSSAAALRADDPGMHFNIILDCYVFKPKVGAVLNGIVRHVGTKHIGCLIYRVFSVKIQFENKINPDQLKLDQEITFRIKQFNFSNLFPYIEGELMETQPNVIPKVSNRITFGDESPNDSGIEERESSQSNEFIDIKVEPLSEGENLQNCQNETPKKAKKRKSDVQEATTPTKKHKTKKSKKNDTTMDDSSQTDLSLESSMVKTEFISEPEESFTKPKKRKSKSSKNTESLDSFNISLDKVKTEPMSSNEDTPTKRTPTKLAKIKIKEEIPEDD